MRIHAIAGPIAGILSIVPTGFNRKVKTIMRYAMVAEYLLYEKTFARLHSARK